MTRTFEEGRYLYWSARLGNCIDPLTGKQQKARVVTNTVPLNDKGNKTIEFVEYYDLNEDNCSPFVTTEDWAKDLTDLIKMCCTELDVDSVVIHPSMEALIGKSPDYRAYYPFPGKEAPSYGHIVHGGMSMVLVSWNNKNPKVKPDEIFLTEDKVIKVLDFQEFLDDMVLIEKMEKLEGLMAEGKSTPETQELSTLLNVPEPTIIAHTDMARQVAKLMNSASAHDPSCKDIPCTECVLGYDPTTEKELDIKFKVEDEVIDSSKDVDWFEKNVNAALKLPDQEPLATFYWSRAPGRFVNKVTGQEPISSGQLSAGPAFYGDVQQWYETLVETIADAGNYIHKQTMRHSGNTIKVGRDVLTILEFSHSFKPCLKEVALDTGLVSVGTLNNRFAVYQDPYLPVNVVEVSHSEPFPFSNSVITHERVLIIVLDMHVI